MTRVADICSCGLAALRAEPDSRLARGHAEAEGIHLPPVHRGLRCHVLSKRQEPERLGPEDIRACERSDHKRAPALALLACPAGNWASFWWLDDIATRGS